MQEYVTIRWGELNRYRRRQAEALMKTTPGDGVFDAAIGWGQADTGGLQPTAVYHVEGRGLVLKAIGNPVLHDDGFAGLVFAAKSKAALGLRATIVGDQLRQARETDANHLGFDKLVVPVLMERMLGPIKLAMPGATGLLQDLEDLGLADMRIPDKWFDADRHAAKGRMVLYRGISVDKITATAQAMTLVTPASIDLRPRHGDPAQLARTDTPASRVIRVGDKGPASEKSFEAGVRGKIAGYELGGGMKRTTKYYPPAR